MSNLLNRWTYYFARDGGPVANPTRNAKTVNLSLNSQRGTSWGTPTSGAAILQSMKGSTTGGFGMDSARALAHWNSR
jgi:hypothetical protein